MRLLSRYRRITKLISPTAKNPYKHIRKANELVVDLARAGEGELADELAERIYFLTEGWKEEKSWTIERIHRALNPKVLPASKTEN